MKNIFKSKKCDWCRKNKKINDGYLLGKFKNSNKIYFICDKCNLKHDVV